LDLHVISFRPEGEHHVVKQKQSSHQQCTVDLLQGGNLPEIREALRVGSI
jgi:hypothetical protein